MLRYVGGHLEGTEEERGVQDYWGDRSERIHLEELGIDILKLLTVIFVKSNGSSKWNRLV